MPLLLALVLTVAAFAGGIAFARRRRLASLFARAAAKGLAPPFARAAAGWLASMRRRARAAWGMPSLGRRRAGTSDAGDVAAAAAPAPDPVVAARVAAAPRAAASPGPAAPAPEPMAAARVPSARGPAAARDSAVVDATSPPAPLARADAASSSASSPPPATLRFDPVAARGTRSLDVELHSPEWRSAMAAVGERLAASDVSAVVFVHGTFTGTDPLSAYGVVARALPGDLGPYVARRLKQKTRGYIERLLGDLGNFGAGYARLFEEAIRPRGARIPCTDFVWSSENHHVGRLEGALGLLRVLATHAELGARGARRILVLGHSHAGQLFALVTQLLARSVATEAILDVARARELDVAALETDLVTLLGAPTARRAPGVAIDFVTFGAPSRYAWATVPSVRALHVIAVPGGASRAGALDGDLVRRLAVEGTDFPPLGVADRRLNSSLASALGHAGFAPSRAASALRAGAGLPTSGEVALVEYGERGLFASGLGHGSYTRLDAMLFHARLVADRLYPAPVAPPDAAPAPEVAPPAAAALLPATRPQAQGK